MKHKDYQVIWLDVDGTLLDFDRAEKVGFENVLLYYGLSLDMGHQAAYHQINKDFWEAFEMGTITRDQVLTGRFERFFESLSMKVDGREAENIYRGQLEAQVFLIDGAVELCRWLQEHYRVYILTNGVSTTQHKRLAAAGLIPFFKDIFVSEDTKSQKPQKEFFDYCFQRTEYKSPGEILMVGDSLSSDMRGGFMAGVDTCWYNPAGLKNETEIRIDYEIQSLCQLKQILEGA